MNPNFNQTPQQVVWMPRPAAMPDSPPDLEYLISIDHVHIEQKTDLVEVVYDFDTNIKYVLRNRAGQHFAYAAEQSSCISRQ
jgi:hypothetical protein